MSQVIGHGSKLSIDTTSGATGASGDTWINLAGVTSIDLGSDKVDTLDNTDMLTPGSTRSYVPGLEDAGDVSAKCNVLPGDTTQAELITLKGVPTFFKAIYPGAIRTVAFPGFITSVDESIPDDKLPTLTVKIKVTGPKTYS